jgi:sugar lactone lactonase YvrE
MGNLYISDSGNFRIRKVSKDGRISTVAGLGSEGFSGDGGSARRAQLGRPIGVAVDKAGNLFIAEANGQRIRKVSADGKIQSINIAGSNSESESLEFTGLAIDDASNLFALDSNGDIRKVSATGAIEVIVRGISTSVQ